MTRSPLTLFAVAALIGLAAAQPSTAAADLTAWQHSQDIRLDTSATGANVKGDVKNYPVAVALNAKNFNFDQAQPAGGDIRVTAGQGGATLPHHIEHWSRDDQTALVWVKVPVVRGNDAQQSIAMHWGNKAAADAGDSRAVFNSDDGFVGVWHLADEPATTKDGYHDATANEAHATGVNVTSESRAAAVLGPGLDLRHAKNQWLKVDGDKRKLFDLTDRVTFSAWANARSFANHGDEAKRALPGYETIFAKGDNSWRLQKFGVRDWHDPPAELVEICVEKAPKGDMCVIGKVDMTKDKWFHFVGVHDHPQARLYVNGVLETAETFDVPWSSGDHPVGIGNQSQFPEQGRAWDGLIDEARVMNVVKDEHWIKLDYESQRPNQRFLTFETTTR